jgi:hypothetical protein
MSTTLVHDAIRESEIRGFVDRGATIVVVAADEPRRVTSGLAGRWEVHAETRGDRRFLVTSRDPSRPRGFKTVSGLISFLNELGFEQVSVPMRKGIEARLAAEPVNAHRIGSA